MNFCSTLIVKAQLRSSDLELGETTKRIFETVERVIGKRALRGRARKVSGFEKLVHSQKQRDFKGRVRTSGSLARPRFV